MVNNDNYFLGKPATRALLWSSAQQAFVHKCQVSEEAFFSQYADIPRSLNESAKLLVQNLTDLVGALLSQVEFILFMCIWKND